jgi:hypothetical protein
VSQAQQQDITQRSQHHDARTPASSAGIQEGAADAGRVHDHESQLGGDERGAGAWVKQIRKFLPQEGGARSGAKPGVMRTQQPAASLYVQ